MNTSLAIAILDVNLKGPTATFDEQGLSAVRWAWETVKAALPVENTAAVAVAPATCAGMETRDETNTPPSEGDLLKALKEARTLIVTLFAGIARGDFATGKRFAADEPVVQQIDALISKAESRGKGE